MSQTCAADFEEKKLFYSTQRPIPSTIPIPFHPIHFHHTQLWTISTNSLWTRTSFIYHNPSQSIPSHNFQLQNLNNALLLADCPLSAANRSHVSVVYISNGVGILSELRPKQGHTSSSKVTVRLMLMPIGDP